MDVDEGCEEASKKSNRMRRKRKMMRRWKAAAWGSRHTNNRRLHQYKLNKSNDSICEVKFSLLLRYLINTRFLLLLIVNEMYERVKHNDIGMSKKR